MREVRDEEEGEGVHKKHWMEEGMERGRSTAETRGG